MQETRTREPVDLVIRGGNVATSGHITPGWIAVAGGKIVAIGTGESGPQAKQTIDASGKYVLLGIIDTEHHPSTSSTLDDDLYRETCGAIAAGVTTVGYQAAATNAMKIPKLYPKREEIPSIMETAPLFIERGDKYCMTDYIYTPAHLTEEHVKEIPDLAEKYGITSFKIYLHAKTGEHIWDMWPDLARLGWYRYDDGTIYRAMKNIAALGPPGLLLLHTENWEIARILKEELLAQGRADVGAWDDHSPAFCEAGHVRHYAYYAKVTGCPIYIIHVTTPETVEEIWKARAEGVKIYGNTSHFYLTLNKDVWRTNVPLRSQDTFPEMWEALRAGAIDSISSDHVYHQGCRSLENIKETGREYKHNVLTYWDGGMGGRVESMLPVMLSEGVNKGRISLERLVEILSENPAKTFGLYPKKGAITIGADADFTIVDLNKTKKVTRDMGYSPAGWSIYEDWELKGWPVMTILRGNIMMEWSEGEPRAKVVGKPIGKYIPRKPGHKLYPLA